MKKLDKTDRHMLVVFSILFLVILVRVLTGCAYVGSRGSTGPAPSIITTPASLIDCPTGGTQVQVGPDTYYACNGAQGATGAVGSNGSNGTDGQSIVGPQGAPGTNGVNGTNGIDGANGADATPITVVNLCPGSTTYPGVFIETALCISGQLYGVYSANNGFLTLLAPGAYVSNAIGSACNLTVGPNCQVSY